MAFNNSALSGFLAGVGITIAGVYLYQKNKDSVNEFLRSQGINIPEQEGEDLQKMTMEELVGKKEEIEDLLAELDAKMKTEE